MDIDRSPIQSGQPSGRHYWKRGSAGSKLFPIALSKPIICLLVPFHQNHDCFFLLSNGRHVQAFDFNVDVWQITSLKTDQMTFWWINYR